MAGTTTPRVGEVHTDGPRRLSDRAADAIVGFLKEHLDPDFFAALADDGSSLDRPPLDTPQLGSGQNPQSTTS